MSNAQPGTGQVIIRVQNVACLHRCTAPDSAGKRLTKQCPSETDYAHASTSCAPRLHACGHAGNLNASTEMFQATKRRISTGARKQACDSHAIRSAVRCLVWVMCGTCPVHPEKNILHEAYLIIVSIFSTKSSDIDIGPRACCTNCSLNPAATAPCHSIFPLPAISYRT